MNGRGPYDWGRVGEDLPNEAVVTAVRAMHSAGNSIVFCSGRDEVCQLVGGLPKRDNER